MNSSRLVGLAVVAIGLFTLFILIPYGIVSPSDIPTLALAPEFWPLIIASVFTLTGVLLAILPATTEKSRFVEPNFWKQRVPRLFLLLAVLFGFYFLVPFTGMILPAILLIFGLSWFAGEKRWKLILVLAFIIPIVLSIFFIYVANIPIPLGLFEFLYR